MVAYWGQIEFKYISNNKKKVEFDRQSRKSLLTQDICRRRPWAFWGPKVENMQNIIRKNFVSRETEDREGGEKGPKSDWVFQEKFEQSSVLMREETVMVLFGSKSGGKDKEKSYGR